MKRRTLLTASLIPFVLSGCFVAGVAEFGGLTQPGPKFTQLLVPNANEAIIYYYRPIAFGASGCHYPVYENGERVTSFYSGGYFPHRTTPGFKVIWTKLENAKKVRFNAEAGKIYFVRGEVDMDGDAIITMKQIMKEQAQIEMRECDLVPASAK